MLVSERNKLSRAIEALGGGVRNAVVPPAIIRDKRLIAVFAGHLHDANRPRYLPPYGWQAARGSRPPEVYEKTFLAPPLAAKFQLDRAPQARGLLVARVTPQGVVRAEIRWFSAPQSEALKVMSW